MRVFQAMAGAEHGGAEGFFERLACALPKYGVDQQVAIRTDAGRTERLRAEGVEPLQYRFGGRLDFITPSKLKDSIRSFNPDIVLTWMSRASRMIKPGDYTLCARLGGYYALKYYDHCDHLIGNTQDIVDYLVKEGWPSERAHYVPNFVTEQRLAAESRLNHATPEDAPLIFALGRLHENKGFDVLLESLSQVPGAYLWLAGVGPKESELKALAEKLEITDRVRFLGWRQDSPALHAAADLFVCPSRHEPLGNVVIEGWAQAKPVIATASQGPAVLIKHGENGLLSPIDDADALAKNIKDAIESPELRESLAANGYASYKAAYAEATVVEQYKEFFEKVRK